MDTRSRTATERREEPVDDDVTRSVSPNGAGPYAGGVRWVRTNPPLRIQLQNDSAPFLNKLSINNREFDYR